MDERGLPCSNPSRPPDFPGGTVATKFANRLRCPTLDDVDGF